MFVYLGADLFAKMADVNICSNKFSASFVASKHRCALSNSYLLRGSGFEAFERNVEFFQGRPFRFEIFDKTR